MNAFHSFWTKPLEGREPEEFEILTMVLSALKWKEKNGDIYLVTDSKGRELIKAYGYESCWDKVYRDLDYIPEEIDYKRFWAAGKIYALRSMPCPVVSIDTDFIVWDSLSLEEMNTSLCVIHKEPLSEQVYPNAEELTRFCDGYSLTEAPVNAAFMYFNNTSLKEEYTLKAMEFMKSTSAEGTLVPMVFAEQRLLSMVAHKMGIETDQFSSLEKLTSGEDKRFTHLWGYKQKVRENQELKKELTNRLKARIKAEFKGAVY